MPMISVIVPVYNTQRYLSTCLKSIINQTYSDLEILLIDDGSTDESGRLCNQYAHMDNRIRVFHKENGGSSSARNAGLSIAAGEYISFVDSDDWIDLNFYEIMLNNIQNFSDIDICISGMIKEGKDNHSTWGYDAFDEQVLSSRDAIWCMLQRKYFCWELCDKLYKHNLFHNFLCDETLSIGEDFATNWKLFQLAEKVLYVPIHGYHYRMHPASMIHQGYDSKHIFLDALHSVMLDYEYMHENLKKYMLTWYIRHIINELLNMYFWNSSEYMEKFEYYRDQLKLWVPRIVERNYLNRRETFIIRSFLKDKEQCDFDLDLQYKKMCLKLRKLYRCYENIYIYGVGVLSQYIVELMNRNQLIYKGFVVSDDQNPCDQVDGHTVWALSTIDKKSDNTLFILAVNEIHKKEIVQNINRAGYKKTYWPELCRFSI